jgi:hypothetical protein
MDFESAVELSKEIEVRQPELIVTGFRRMRADAQDSWAIDIMNRQTERVATVDEKDLLEVRVAEIAGN